MSLKAYSVEWPGPSSRIATTLRSKKREKPLTATSMPEMRGSDVNPSAQAEQYGAWNANRRGLPRQTTVKTHVIVSLLPPHTFLPRSGLVQYLFSALARYR